MRVAAAQMTSGPDVSANLAVAAELAEAAALAGAGLLALPENFAFMGLHDADKRRVAEPHGAGQIQSWLVATARRLKLWIVAGTIPLARSDGERVAAACLVFDDSGREAGRYDKIHLFDVDLPERGEKYRESTHISPGSSANAIETPFGRLGLSVCYDVRFPELYRQLSASGAQLLTVPSAFTTATGRAHWEPLLRARAIENLCYVIAPAQSGFHPSARETYGDSMIVDYWGRVLARRPRGRGIVVAEIELARQAEARAAFPALAHRVL
jgi:deaminated glutathione amidase